VEEEKREKKEEERSGSSTPSSTKEISILTSPMNPGTPLNVISSNFSYSSLKLLEFDDESIVVGNFYYSNSKEGITNRPSKRLRIVESSKHFIALSNVVKCCVVD
jgi:hypothetical protein